MTTTTTAARRFCEPRPRVVVRPAASRAEYALRLRQNSEVTSPGAIAAFDSGMRIAADENTNCARHHRRATMTTVL